MELTERFSAERPRLVSLATRVLGNAGEAEDIVQQAWLRMDNTTTDIDNLPAWLTTVTTRLCLDRLRMRTPVPEEDLALTELSPDPAEVAALADAVGIALQVVLDRFSQHETVAFAQSGSAPCKAVVCVSV